MRLERVTVFLATSTPCVDTGFKLLSKLATWFASIQHVLSALFSLVWGLSFVTGTGGNLNSGAMELSVWFLLESLLLHSGCLRSLVVVGMLLLASELFRPFPDCDGKHLRSL